MTLGRTAERRSGRTARKLLVVLVTALIVALGGFTATGTARPAAAPSAASAVDHGLLIADYRNKRLLITDLTGGVVWSWDNPTGNPSDTAGPLGVRWYANGKILATFGGGEVGLIDVATKSFDWMTEGFDGEWFESPYDAQLLPGGHLAVATRFNDGGRVAVYHRATGERVWSTGISNAHSLLYRPAAQSYDTDLPTLIVGGWGKVKEVTYQPGRRPRTVWETPTEFTHDVMPSGGGTLLTSEGYYIQRIDRDGDLRWRRDTPNEARRFAPNPAGGFIVSIAHSNRIEFRTARGYVDRSFSRLSDGTRLNYPYGIRLLDLAQVP